MPLEAPVITTTHVERSRATGGRYPGAQGHKRRVPSIGAMGTRMQMSARVTDVGPFQGHAPEDERPLGGYALLMVAFAALAGGFAGWFRSSGRELPERVDGRDLALVTVATHKASRLIAKDRVTSAVRAPFTRYEEDEGPSEVGEAARGHGLRRAVGEL